MSSQYLKQPTQFTRPEHLLCEKERQLLSELEFHSDWEYFNPHSGAWYKCGIVAGNLFYIKLVGHFDLHDAEMLEKSLESLYATQKLASSHSVGIGDYSELISATAPAKRRYIFATKRIEEKYNSVPSIRYLIGVSALIRVSVRIAITFLRTKIIFFDSIHTAIENVETKLITESTTKKPQALTISQADLDEIDTYCGEILYNLESPELFENSSQSSGPLRHLKESLVLVAHDLKEMRDQQDAYIQELAENRLSLVKMMEKAELAIAD